MIPTAHGSGLGLREATSFRAPAKRTGRGSRSVSGISLVECVVAVAVLGISFVGLMSGISYMRMENMADSQRMLVASEAAQILELFKALPYSAIVNSTSTSTCLMGYGTSSPDTNWQVPLSGGTMPLPVDDVNSSSSTEPSPVPNKIPNGQWSVTLASAGNGLTQITVTITWKLYAGSTRPPESYSMSTIVYSGFPNV
jgi:type II secretory pathway pseudopilin PulG